MCGYVHVRTRTFGARKARSHGASVAYNCERLRWVLGIKLFSTRMLHALNLRAISLGELLFIFMTFI